MPHNTRQPRLPAALRSAVAQIQAGVNPQNVAADLIIKRAERVVMCAQLPPGDPRLPAIHALTQALETRTFDDSAISLEACLRDLEESGRADGKMRGLTA